MTRMTLKQARRIGDVAHPTKCSLAALGEALEVLMDRGHGSGGEDARRERGIRGRIGYMEWREEKRQAEARGITLRETMSHDEFRDGLDAREWDRENGCGANHWL